MMAQAKRAVIDRGIEGVAALLPEAALTGLIARSTDGFDIALCLHRVLPEHRADVTMPGLSNTEEEIDQLLRLFRRNPERLTMTFDDGYDDARAFIESRAPAHPEVHWIFMICPEKTVERRSFPWDDWTVEGNGPHDHNFLHSWKEATRKRRERARGQKARANMEPFRLATPEQCRRLAELPNVELGNHTNHHFAMAWLTPSEVDREIVDSDEKFAEEFGECNHFAFPFGAPPRVHPEHIERATELIDSTIWTIDNQPAPADDDGDARVRPRFAWDATRLSPRGMGLFVALKCCTARSRSSIASFLERLRGRGVVRSLRSGSVAQSAP